MVVFAGNRSAFAAFMERFAYSQAEWMPRKQDSPEVATEKALALAEYESEQRNTLNRLAKLREERLQREAAGKLQKKKRAG